ncbi:MAG: hypothetical protein AAF958_15415 [Planctomycetota bacterium]
MANSATTSGRQPIDEAFVRHVTATVLARLRQAAADSSASNSDVNRSAASSSPVGSLPVMDSNVLAMKVISASTIASLPANQVVKVSATAVVTPAAKDEAKRRGMTLHAVDAATNGVAADSNRVVTKDSVATEITGQKLTSRVMIEDQTGKHFDIAVIKQLQMRGVVTRKTKWLLTHRPFAVCAQCWRSGTVAAVAESLLSLDEMIRDLRPSVWIVDPARLGLPTIVSMIQRVEQASGGSP